MVSSGLEMEEVGESKTEESAVISEGLGLWTPDLAVKEAKLVPLDKSESYKLSSLI